MLVQSSSFCSVAVSLEGSNFCFIGVVGRLGFVLNVVLNMGASEDRVVSNCYSSLELVFLNLIN
jgi:hypothetical protein